MLDGYDNGGRRLASGIANWRDGDALEWAIEVPMLEPTRIARDNRRFVAVYVVGVVAVTVRMMMLAVMIVMMVIVPCTGVIVMMDVRIVSSAMPMMNHAHDAGCLSLGIDFPTSVLPVASRYRVSLPSRKTSRTANPT
jgi:hypothetical protein